MSKKRTLLTRLFTTVCIVGQEGRNVHISLHTIEEHVDVHPQNRRYSPLCFTSFLCFCHLRTVTFLAFLVRIALSLGLLPRGWEVLHIPDNQ